MFVVLLKLELTGMIVHMVAGSKWSSFCITLGIHLVTISSNKSVSFSLDRRSGSTKGIHVDNVQELKLCLFHQTVLDLC